MVEVTERGRTRFPMLSAEAFISDRDKVALDNLKKTPLVPVLVKKFNELAGDRLLYVINSGSAIRCGPKQYKTLYGLLTEACSILDVPEPELYVRYSGHANAFTAGIKRTFVVLQSPVLDYTDDELLYIIGHELGHIKCGHIVYQEVGRILIPLLSILGQMTFGLGNLASFGVVAAFYEWMRQAEYSCDRAGLLACQKPRTALSAIMKLGSGASRFDSEMDLDAFMEQARSHAEMGGLNALAKALLFFQFNWYMSHPQVVYRAKGLEDWQATGAYKRIMGGEFAVDPSGGDQLGPRVYCETCDVSFPATVKFCPSCGAELKVED